MISKEYIILAPEGMHARPATALIRLAKKFKSAIHLKKNGNMVRLNSMLNILSMAIKSGETILVTVEGEDEGDAAAAMEIFFTEELIK